MKSYKLTRTGQPPLCFTGERLAEASSHQHQGPLNSRWHEVEVYRTQGGKWVASFQFSTTWQGENFQHAVVVRDDDKGLIDALQHFDATAGWSGHPAGTVDAERKNAQLRAAIVGGYRRCLTKLFEELGLAEEIE